MTLAPGVLLVNEFIATGSQSDNELVNGSDWFEIYNPSANPLELIAGRWFVSDDLGDPTKYQLPHVTIPAFGHLVIWCDNQNTVITQIHTNFALSATGEDLVIHYDDGNSSFNADAYSYGPQTTQGSSIGRYPDGGEQWIEFQSPTPGGPNQ